jgi:hypothetical protein
MFQRNSGTSSRNAFEESTKRRFESSSVRSMNMNMMMSSSGQQEDLAGEAQFAAPSATDSQRGGGPRFFRRHGSQPSLMYGVPGLLARGMGGSSAKAAKKRTSPPPPPLKSSQLSLSTASLTTSPPSAQPHYAAVAMDPAPVTPSSQSQRSPVKKKVNRRSSDTSPQYEGYAQVPRIIMGPPIVSAPSSSAPRKQLRAGGNNNGTSRSASGSSSSGGGLSSSAGSSGRVSSTSTGKASSSSRPSIYIPHLNDTVSSFDRAQNAATTAASTTPPPLMDYCHHVRDVVRKLPPYVVPGAPAPSSSTRTTKPNLLPSDEAWLAKGSDHYTARKSRSEDEDTDINDEEYGREYDDDEDDDDGKSGSMCDTLHNSLGNDDSYRPRRMPMPMPPPPTSHERAVSLCEDSLFNGSSVGETDSFRLPGAYSVCDDSLHNSSSMGTSSYRRRFDAAIDDGDEYDYDDDDHDENNNNNSNAAMKAFVTASLVGATVPVLEEEEEEEGEDEGGRAHVNENKDKACQPQGEDDEQSLSPEEAVEVTHRHITNPRARIVSDAPEATRSSPSSATRESSSSSRPAGIMTNNDRDSGSIIEIFPGCKVPLRGCHETWGSFREGTAVLVPCSSCLNCVYCVPVATMVLCPHCRDISPLATTIENENSEASVGLGMSVHESKAFLDA